MASDPVAKRTGSTHVSNAIARPHARSCVTHFPRSGKANRRGITTESGRARCGRVLHAKRIASSRSAGPARQPHHEVEAGQADMRALWLSRHISPWLSLLDACGRHLAALITGNAVVIKPSEFTPVGCARIAKANVRAGLDPDLLQVVVGEGPAGAALIDSGVDNSFLPAVLRPANAWPKRLPGFAPGGAGVGRQRSDDRAARR